MDNNRNVFVSLTVESKIKGDEGCYAAIEAARLARSLRGSTVSRLAARERLAKTTVGQLVLGAPPAKYSGEIMEQIIRDTRAEVFRQEPRVSHHDTQVPIGLPDDVTSTELQEVVPFMEKLEPGSIMSYDNLQQMLYLLNTTGSSVTSLDLAGVVNPQSQPEQSPQALQKKVHELQMRYPLPVPKVKDAAASSDEEDEEDPESLLHNEELRARCEACQIEYTTYRNAVRDLALYEMRVFVLLCDYLCEDTKLKVLQLDHNKLGAESAKVEGTVNLIPLRALARMIDLNETIKLLDLSYNDLGPNGIGILSKALTKNICMVEVNLAGNNLGADPLDETEDPEYEEEDPVFGEVYSGLEAISEVIKKNKFLRILRLGHNGIHGGDALDAPPPEEDAFADFQPDEDANNDEAADAWEDLPLWKLVKPLMSFHRLHVLDLTGNQLKATGTRMLATALAKNRSIRVLDLTDNAIGFRGLHYLANLVLPSPVSVLHTLILRRNDMAGRKTSKAQQKAALAAMKAFAAGLRGNRTLRRLILSENHLGATLSAALLETIGAAEVLEELDFSTNEACGDHPSLLDTTAARYLATALYPAAWQSYPPTLSKLVFSGNNLCNGGLAVLFPHGFAPQYALRELDLSRNSLHNALDPIASLLKVSPTLSWLNLSHNAISDLATLLPGIDANDTLECLDISHNDLGMVEHLLCPPNAQIAAVQCMWESLSRHPTLNDLNVSWNDLRSAHCESLLATYTTGTDVFTHLRKMDISNNPKLPATQVQAMVNTIALHPGMEVFYASVSAQEQTTAAEGLLQSMKAVVDASPTLLDISCGLRGESSLLLDESEGTRFGSEVGAMRRQLLLNALTCTEE